jgi:hypothetical protein
MMKRGMGSAVSEAALLLALAIVGGAQAAEPQCTFPNEILDMGHPLHRTSRPISTGVPLTIVALGSSDALPYELDMLDAAAKRTRQFS